MSASPAQVESIVIDKYVITIHEGCGGSYNDFLIKKTLFHVQGYAAR